MAKKKKPISQSEQSRRFLEAAREAGVEDADKNLRAIVKRIVGKPKPRPRPK